MRIDFIGDQVDTTAPVVKATVEGPRNGAGNLGRATLTLDATDASGVSRVEYSLDGSELDALHGAVAFTTRGRSPCATAPPTRRTTPRDPAGRVQPSWPAPAACPRSRTSSAARWTRRAGATGTRRRRRGARAPSVADGHLRCPLGAFSLDLARTGPAAILAQPLPTGDFTLVTKITAPGLNADTGGQGSTYAQVGLKLFQTNDNWIKVSHSRNADGNPTGATSTYFELAYEINGTRTLGTRTGLGTGNLPTWWLRVVRAGATLAASYSLSDPEGTPNWVALGTANIDTVMPAASGPRYIGVYGGNGSTTASYDYLRFTPDSATDTAPPVSSHTAPAPDGAGGWYRTPVDVTLERGRRR